MRPRRCTTSGPRKRIDQTSRTRPRRPIIWPSGACRFRRRANQRVNDFGWDDTNGHRRTQTARASAQFESARSRRHHAGEAQPILTWKRVACRAKSLRTHLSPRTESIRFLIRSIRSIRISAVDGMHSAALNPHGNRRSGWLREIGTTRKRIERIERRRQTPAGTNSLRRAAPRPVHRFDSTSAPREVLARHTRRCDIPE